MYLTLPWFIALVFFSLAAFFWAVLEIGGLHRRYEQVSYDLDRWRDDLNDRLERAEDWVRHLDERTRQQAGAVKLWTPEEQKPPMRVSAQVNTEEQDDPGTVPMTVPGPTTEPIVLPVTQPQAAVLLAQLDDPSQRWYEDAMARINAIAEGAK